MQRDFSMSNDKVIINFTTKYCSNFESLLDSEGFRRVVDAFIKKIEKKNTLSYRYLTEALETNDAVELRRDLLKIFKYLTVLDLKDIKELNNKYGNFLEDKDKAIVLIEELYLFWRRLERYTLIHGGKKSSGLAAMSFTEANDGLSKLILKFYRKIEKNILGKEPKVFRQIPAGGNSCIMINEILWPVPNGYEKLERIPFIDSILLETPFITYPKRNTRTGMF